MTLRHWLWAGTVLNAMILLPAAFMAFSAIGFAMTSSGIAGGIALLFVALPIFCVVAPFAAWRLHRKHPRDLNAAFMMTAPLIYAAFLIAFLNWGA